MSVDLDLAVQLMPAFQAMEAGYVSTAFSKWVLTHSMYIVFAGTACGMVNKTTKSMLRQVSVTQAALTTSSKSAGHVSPVSKSTVVTRPVPSPQVPLFVNVHCST